jgi:hypothetical protein
VSGLGGTVTKATLRLHVLRGGGKVFFHTVRAVDWNERRLTFARAPRLGRTAAAARVPRRGGWGTFDVIPLVQRSGFVTIGLSATRPVVFSSREAGRAAELRVETGAAAVALAVGDIADCASRGDEATAQLVQQLPGTVLALGDLAYPAGRAEDFRCYDASWGAFKSRTRPVPGNHEYMTRDAAPYFDYFGAAAGMRGSGYYSFDLGGWHIVAVNSNCSRVRGCGAGSPQERWLRSDLAASTRRCTLAFWHHPLFSSGQHGGFRSMRALWDALYAAGAEIVLSGHDHDYERFAPQTSSGGVDTARGIRQFVVGTGGKNYYRLGNPVANSEIRNANTFGVLQLTLLDDGYRWRFLPEAGKSFTDSGSGSCH